MKKLLDKLFKPREITQAMNGIKPPTKTKRPPMPMSSKRRTIVVPNHQIEFENEK